MRHLSIVLLIANLVVCPLRCTAVVADESADNAVAIVDCGCCHDAEAESNGAVRTVLDQSDVDSSQGPQVPSNECSCPDCICDGATLQEDESQVDAGVTLVQWILDDHAIKLGSCTALGDGSRAKRHVLRHSCLSGEDALVAFQTWLI